MPNTDIETPWQPASHVTILQDVSTNTTATITTPKPLRPLTRKQKAFVQHLVNNPKDSATKAVQATYNVDNPRTASVVASENLAKPNVMLELSKHSATAELVLLEVMNTSKEFSQQGNTAGASYATSAITAANSILDRLHGKATIKTETKVTAVTLNIDLTGTIDSGQPVDN